MPLGGIRGQSSGKGSFKAGLDGGYPHGPGVPNASLLLSLPPPEPPSEPASAPVGEPGAQTAEEEEEAAVVEDGPARFGWTFKSCDKTGDFWFEGAGGNRVPDCIAEKHVNKMKLAPHNPKTPIYQQILIENIYISLNM